MNLKDLHPAKLFSMVEVIVAGAAAFLPLSGTQVAAICAIAAVATGQQVTKKAACNH
jgi:hypothetical protein